MSADQDQVFQDDEYQRQWDEQADIANAERHQDEMMAEQNLADLAVLMRVSSGETTHMDFLYLVGRLKVNLMEK